jgi:hypothetical protein
MPLIASLLALAGAVTLAADAPIAASINGQPVALQLSTGNIDRVVLPAAQAGALGLKPAFLMGKATVRLGGAKVLAGRNSVASLVVAGASVKQRVLWFERSDGLAPPASIGPSALPQDDITITLGGPGGTRLALPLIGGTDSALQGGVALGTGTSRIMFSLPLDVQSRQRLPLATAATGADLAAALGGHFTGEVWDEDVLLGITRPVRKLVLDRPLVIGPLRFTEIAVRVRDRRDAMGTIAPGQQLPPSDDDDPSEIVVAADAPHKRPVVRSITLGRQQLAGCASIRFDKPARQLLLDCAS